MVSTRRAAKSDSTYQFETYVQPTRTRKRARSPDQEAPESTARQPSAQGIPQHKRMKSRADPSAGRAGSSSMPPRAKSPPALRSPTSPSLAGADAGGPAFAAAQTADKRTPTLSGKGRKNAKLNNTVSVDQGIPGKPATLVECGHLAYAYLHPELVETFIEHLAQDSAALEALLEEVPPELGQKLQEAVGRSGKATRGPKLKFLDLVAQSPATLRAFFSMPGVMADGEAHAKQTRSLDASCKQLVGNRQFGAWIADMGDQMRAQEATECKVVLAGRDHEMAVHLEWKRDDDGADRLRVTCYDPNNTGNHKAFEVRSTSELRADPKDSGVDYSMDKCFDHLDSYFPDEHEDPGAYCMTAICSDVLLDPPQPARYFSLHSSNGALDRQAFNEATSQALISGVHPLLQPLAQELSARGTRGADAVPFVTVHTDEGTTGTFEAFKNKDGRSITRYAQMLSHLGITGQDAVPLMRAMHANGTMGGYEAFEEGDGQTLKDYAVALKYLGIEGEMAVPLMRVFHGKGTSGTFSAILNNRTEVFEDYAKALNHLGIRGALAEPLLEVVDPDGEKGVEFLEVDPTFAEGIEAYKAARHQLGC